MKLQREELQVQREEVKETRKVLKDQEKQLENQKNILLRESFECSFFKLLDYSRKSIERLKHRGVCGNVALMTDDCFC